MDRQLKMSKNLQYKMEELEMRGDIRPRITCMGAKCEEDKALLPRKWGLWKIRGVCEKKGLKVEVRRYLSSGVVSRDPLRKKPMAWKSLFTGNEYVCSYPDPVERKNGVSKKRKKTSPRRLEQNIEGVSEEDFERAIHKAKEWMKKICPEGKSLQGLNDSMELECE